MVIYAQIIERRYRLARHTLIREICREINTTENTKNKKRYENEPEHFDSFRIRSIKVG